MSFENGYSILFLSLSNSLKIRTLCRLEFYNQNDDKALIFKNTKTHFVKSSYRKGFLKSKFDPVDVVSLSFQ